MNLCVKNTSTRLIHNQEKHHQKQPSTTVRDEGSLWTSNCTKPYALRLTPQQAAKERRARARSRSGIRCQSVASRRLGSTTGVSESDCQPDDAFILVSLFVCCRTPSFLGDDAREWEMAREMVILCVYWRRDACKPDWKRTLMSNTTIID